MNCLFGHAESAIYSETKNTAFTVFRVANLEENVRSGLKFILLLAIITIFSAYADSLALSI